LNAFTEDDRMIFEAVADNIATAIHNADLYRSEQWRRQVGESLREVAGLVSANVGVDDVLEAILDELDRNLPVDVSAIWLFDNDELYLAACRNCDEDLLEQTLYDDSESYDGLLSALYSEAPIIRKPDRSCSASLVWRRGSMPTILRWLFPCASATSRWV
jgi:phosphoserine phosphatase RsbU/P